MKCLRLVLCILLVFACITATEASGLASIQGKINSASKLWETDAVKAQAILREAFSGAIAWTKAEYVDSVREQGFLAAVSCLSPELIDEVALAADTYLKVFPTGRYAKKINIYRAMAAYAVKDYATAESSLNLAARAGSLSYREQSYVMSGFLASGKHRTAEKFIEGQRITRPSGKLTKDLKRLHSGNRLVEGLLNRFAAGKISGQKAAELLDSAVKSAWFAKRAPEAALNVITLRDNQAPFYNSIVTEWCSLERVVKHASSPQLRLKKLQEFVAGFPEAQPEEMFKALIDLRYLYIYEFNDLEAAKEVMATLKSIDALAEKAEVEEIVSAFNPQKIATEAGFSDLKRLLELSYYLPYDNGHLPVVTVDHVEYMLALSDMALNRNSTIRNIQRNGWKNLPVDMLYSAAIGDKSHAWEIYQSIKSANTAQVNKMLEDLLMPLYMPVKAKDRLFLAGLAAVEIFPDLGTDLLIDAVSGQPRMFKAEHGLAVIADVYSHHMAISEAQHVWKLLADSYPDSVWLK
ncbi:MAG: hypothetical protein EOM80_04595 [Erysipelotrichia bacterium]|nr:hypothetical protein [Erysipelotrichia bacterium]